VVKIRWRKHASFLIVTAIFAATFVPIGGYVVVKAMPYLNLLPLMDDPSGLGLAGMEIVEVNFDNFSVEHQYAFSHSRIDVDHSIWSIDGIYLENESSLDSKTNYFNPTTFIADNSIYLTDPLLPNYTYINEYYESEHIVSRYGYDFNLSQSADDAWTQTAGTNYTSDGLELGGHQNAAQAAQKRICLRWNISIPQNAYITNAYINLTVRDTSTAPVYNGMTIRTQAFASSSTPPFDDTGEDIKLTRTRTTNYVQYALAGGLTENNTVQFPDISSLVNEIVSRDDWENNSIFGVYIYPQSGVTGTPAPGEIIEFWSYDAGITDYYPKLVIDWDIAEDPMYSPEPSETVRQEVVVDTEITNLIGVWNTSDHSFGNLYNESNGHSYNGKIITFPTPITPGKTPLWITYESEIASVIVEYSIKKWTSMIWRLDLQVKNTLSSALTFPAANLSLNYLDGLLGDGWISEDTVIGPGQSGTVEINLLMQNDRTFQAFVQTMLLGLPLELAANFDAYILVDGLLNDPFLGIVFGTELGFPFPSGGGGTPPFIGAINRSKVSANNDVIISVNASDLGGTGISNRTYLYYSTDSGNSWDQVQMTGGTWINNYMGADFEGYFPIVSADQEETYIGVIPGANMSAGTEVLWYIYLEDYAGNIEHIKPGNWVVSENYSFTVPSSGELEEEIFSWTQETGVDFFSTFMGYLESYGVNINAYMYSLGINAATLIPLLGAMAGFFYDNNIDSNHAVGMLLINMDAGLGILADSGVAAGYLLNLFGMNFDGLLEHISTHIFRPIRDDIYEMAIQSLQEIVVVDDMEPIIAWMPDWDADAIGAITVSSDEFRINNEAIGAYSLNWNTWAPGDLVKDFGSELISFSEDDILSFYLDYDNYSRINESMSIAFVDTLAREMVSSTLSFDNVTYGTFQEIVLYLNSTDFTVDPGFNFDTIQEIKFSYSRDVNPSGRIAESTNITCVADVNNNLNRTYFTISAPGETYFVWINMTGGEDLDWTPLTGWTGIAVNTIGTNDDNITVAAKIADVLQNYGGSGTIFTASAYQGIINLTNSITGPVPDAADGIYPTNFTFSVTPQGDAEDVDIVIDYISVYTPRMYELHQDFTDLYELTNTVGAGSISWFLSNVFQGPSALPPIVYEDIIAPTDWAPNTARTSIWNFLDLCATANSTNNHMTAALWLLEGFGLPLYYDKLVSILGGSTMSGPTSPKAPQEIYQYTFSLSLMMGYVPLALISYKVIKKEIIKRRTLNGKISKPNMEKKRR